jgi:N-hydroxyarylamine O-acetyltransferase
MGLVKVDLNAYFARIGYEGEWTPSLQCLKHIHLRHAQSIPFENLDSLLKRPVLLDPASLETKLVRRRRGGYCFEQNLLLSHALSAVGFAVTGLLARVVWMAPEETVTPRSHMVLLVKAEGDTYVVDAGFGGQTLTGPLLLESDREQPTPHEPFRLLERNGDWTLEALVKDQWKPLYRFDLTPQHQVDFEVANWYTSTHPSSHFVTSLVAAKPAPGCRYTLRNNEFAVHYTDGRTQRRTVGEAAELRDLLASVFGVVLPDSVELESELNRISTADYSPGNRDSAASVFSITSTQS